MTRTRLMSAALLAGVCGCQPLQPAGQSPPGDSVVTGTTKPLEPAKPAVAPLLVPKESVAANNPAADFDHFLSSYKDSNYQALSRELGLSNETKKLSFVPTETQYFERVRGALALVPSEVESFRKHGVISIDHGKSSTMGSIYFSIWSRELPVLITTDSILHALHRSYDTVLKELELTLFFERIDQVMDALHAEVPKVGSEQAFPEFAASLRDVDLYVTVARNLLAGAGDPADVLGHSANTGSAEQNAEPMKQGEQLLVEPTVADSKEVKRTLESIASLRMQTADNPTVLFGGRRPIDYSQFKPRGHYAENPMLQRYFRAMMWLGRADLGFHLSKPPGSTGWVVDVERERRDAALLMQLLERTNSLKALQSVSEVIDFMVGHADNPTPPELLATLKEVSATNVAGLGDTQKLSAWVALVNERRQSSLIRSHVQVAPRHGATTPLATYVQLFGQRFVLDSFMLSKLVYDAIQFQGTKPERVMPQGLDVMAALGNNHATKLLRPELEAFNYAGNLMAARKVTAAYDDSRQWETDVYGMWLDTLRTLHQPETGKFFPEVMQTEVWEAKQLQTQLASWAELRHDTILYAKQSYGSYPLCGYPRGYVEPYPKFFSRITTLAREAANRLSKMDVSSPNLERTSGLVDARDQRVSFFDNFAHVTERLGQLATKELNGEAFTPEEEQFVQDTVQIESPMGSGGPRYDGWYSGLLYGVAPDESKPTIADVHTNPRDGDVLEVGVGDAKFIVVAIDNGKDRATYVGPAYSYYEFTKPASERMTDEEWEQMLATATPPRPAWTNAFVAPVVQRSMAKQTTRVESQATKHQTRVRQLSEGERRQQQINAENARLRELKRALAAASTERDRAAHQRAIDLIERAKCARDNPFPYRAVEDALQAASERAAKCFKGTTEGPTCAFEMMVNFEPNGRKSVVPGASYVPDPKTHACVERAFAAVAAPTFCGVPFARRAFVRCPRQ